MASIRAVVSTRFRYGGFRRRFWTRQYSRDQTGRSPPRSLKAFGSAFEHALVGVSKVLVVAFGQFGELALDIVRAEDAAQLGHRQLEG